MNKVLCISKKDTRKVFHELKVGDSINFDYNTITGDNNDTIKITRIVANSAALIISGSNAVADYVLDIDAHRYTRIGVSNYTTGTIVGSIACKGEWINLNRNSSPWKFEYQAVQKNALVFAPIAQGDTLYKDGCNYQVLAVAGDGKVFVQRELHDGFKDSFKSQVIDPKDESGYTAFGLVSKLKSEIK